MQKRPIGIFDSGYGGLTVMREILQRLPQYDYLYLGDNARAPYGNRSFDTVYHYTLQAVRWLFSQGSDLIILACNTASARALRNIQQKILPAEFPGKKVLGVIRPTTERLGLFSRTREVGILATSGTVNSGSYLIELEKFFPDLTVHQEACPLWVPLIETGEHDHPGAAYFIAKHVNALLSKGNSIDTILLACTHFPLLRERILEFLPAGVQLVEQGEIVAESLRDYLQRHPELAGRLSTGSSGSFFTTDSAEYFNQQAGRFFGAEVNARQVEIDDGKRSSG